MLYSLQSDQRYGIVWFNVYLINAKCHWPHRLRSRYWL